MLKYILITALFISIGLSCSVKKSISGLQDVYQRQVADTIILKSGTFYIDQTIIVENNTFLKGNNTTFVFKDMHKLPLLKISNVSNVGFSGITFKGLALSSDKSRDEVEAWNYMYVVDINKSNKIQFEDCKFSNTYGTVIKINDSENIDIKRVIIDQVGIPTSSKMIYSYDGVFVGGYVESKNINISNCIFKNIGSSFPSGNLPWPNDGDGIHIQSAGNIENVNISNNVFDGCASRGIKLQSGKKITIENNSFKDCRAAVNLAMAYNLKDIKIANNVVVNSLIPFGTDGSPTVDGLNISRNKVDKCDHFFRTSGKSNVINATFEYNEVEAIDTYFLNGRFVNTTIKNNSIKKYANANNKSYNFCIYIAPESDNVSIIDNYFGKRGNADRELLLKSSKRINVSRNVFEIDKQ